MDIKLQIIIIMAISTNMGSVIDSPNLISSMFHLSQHENTKKDILLTPCLSLSILDKSFIEGIQLTLSPTYIQISLCDRTITRFLEAICFPAKKLLLLPGNSNKYLLAAILKCANKTRCGSSFYPCNVESVKMPRPLLIFSQSNYLNQVVDTNYT